MKRKTFYVSIEQPMCKTFEVEAVDIDTALDIAKEKYHTGEFVIGPDDTGTDPQIMAMSHDEDDTGEHEATDWQEF